MIPNLKTLGFYRRLLKSMMKSFNGDPTMFHQLLIYILDAELMQERKF